MANYPNPKPGDTQLKASEWQFLISQVKKVAQDTAKNVFNADRATMRHPPEVTVLVVGKDSNAKTLTVRPVRYQTTPPQGCEGEGESKTCSYSLGVDAFDAYPDFGWTLDSYDDDLFDPATDTLDDTAPFLRAYFDAGTWRLQRPKGGAADWKLCRILGAGTTAITLVVQPIKVEPASGGSWMIDNDGELEEVFCWPPLTVQAYERIFNAAVIPITRMEEHKGVWYVRQLFPWRMKEPRGRPAGSCTI